jgi:hypothetical protein
MTIVSHEDAEKRATAYAADWGSHAPEDAASFFDIVSHVLPYKIPALWKISLSKDGCPFRSLQF